jgi:hypothetical protein
MQYSLKMMLPMNNVYLILALHDNFYAKSTHYHINLYCAAKRV